MEEQWQAMIDGLERTDQIIERMKEQRTEMGLQNETMRGQLAQIQRQADLAEKQIRIIAEGQRAHIGIQNVIQTIVVEGKRPELTILFHNGGQTAARFVTAHGFIFIGEIQGVDSVRWDSPPPQTGSGSTLVAGGDRPIRFVGGEIFTKAHLQAIAKGQKLLTVGKLYYVDFLDDSQELPFQMVWNPNDKSWDDYYGQDLL
jgi:hypothetical protein